MLKTSCLLITSVPHYVLQTNHWPCSLDGSLTVDCSESTHGRRGVAHGHHVVGHAFAAFETMAKTCEKVGGHWRKSAMHHQHRRKDRDVRKVHFG
jgi:hypothetical protein